MPGDALITIVGRELRLETPFDRDFVAALKQLIPGRDRRWDADTKIWIVHKMFRRQVEELCGEYFDEVVVEEEKAPALPVQPQPPLDVITRAYANIIRSTTDDALLAIVNCAVADRELVGDKDAVGVINDAFSTIVAYRDQTGQTG